MADQSGSVPVAVIAFIAVVLVAGPLLYWKMYLRPFLTLRDFIRDDPEDVTDRDRRRYKNSKTTVLIFGPLVAFVWVGGLVGLIITAVDFFTSGGSIRFENR